MYKNEIKVSPVDIKNAEKFFDKTGEGAKAAYKEIDENVDKVSPEGIQSIFLYIPGTSRSEFKLYHN